METPIPPLEENHNRVARDRMLAELGAIAANAEALLQATAHDVSDKAKETRARLVTALNQARATYEEYKAEPIAAAKAAVSKADETVRAHPYEAIAIAFGVGLLLGVVLRRK